MIFFDALRVKIRDEGLVRNKAVHLALGIRADGAKEILGLWLEQNEGAKFWRRVMNELKNRGVEDVLIAVVDGLKGFPEAITAVFPQTTVQTCIVHLLRHSLDFVAWKDRKPVAAALKEIYRAVDAAAGETALTAFPGDVRRILYTTDEVDKPFRRDLLSSSSTGDRVAKSRDQGCKPDHAALSVVPPLRRPCAASHCRAVAIG